MQLELNFSLKNKKLKHFVAHYALRHYSMTKKNDFKFPDIRGRLFSSWPVLFGCHLFYIYPIMMNLFANEHKLVLVSGTEV